MGMGRGENGGKVQGIRSIVGWCRIEGVVGNSMGSGNTKELICTFHGYELRGGIARGNGGTSIGGKRGKMGQLQ